MSTETKTEPEDLLQQMRLHTSMWADDRIALFKTRGNTMIAYVPSDLFKIWVVVFVRRGKVSYLRACFGDSTKISLDDHVLRLINSEHDMAQTLERKQDSLTYHDPASGEKLTMTVRRLSGPMSPQPRTYAVIRDNLGIVTGFKFNR
jgi:hypothetical protein